MAGRLRAHRAVLPLAANDARWRPSNSSVQWAVIVVNRVGDISEPGPGEVWLRGGRTSHGFRCAGSAMRQQWSKMRRLSKNSEGFIERDWAKGIRAPWTCKLPRRTEPLGLVMLVLVGRGNGRSQGKGRSGSNSWPRAFLHTRRTQQLRPRRTLGGGWDEQSDVAVERELA